SPRRNSEVDGCLYAENRSGSQDQRKGNSRNSLMPRYLLRVPASSANLGPGFDALGLALGVYLTCRFARSEALSIRAEGRDSEQISTGPDNLIWQTAVTVAQNHRMQMPPVDL